MRKPGTEAALARARRSQVLLRPPGMRDHGLCSDCTGHSVNGVRAYRSTWVDPRSWFWGLISLLLKVGAMHGTHYETTNPSLVCTNPTSSGQTAGSNLAVIASVRSSRALAGWASAGGGGALAPQPRTARRIGLRHDTRLLEARVVTKPDLNDCKRDECYEPAPSQLRDSTQVDLYSCMRSATTQLPVRIGAGR